MSTASPHLSLFIPGPPVAFARARSNGKRRFEAPAQAAYKTLAGTIARAAMARAGYQPFDGPIEVSYRATFNWPETWSQKRKDQTVRKVSKPDIDNCFKLIADALNGIVFVDDARIARVVAEKVYGRPVGVTLTIDLMEAA